MEKLRLISSNCARKMFFIERKKHSALLSSGECLIFNALFLFSADQNAEANKLKAMRLI